MNGNSNHGGTMNPLDALRQHVTGAIERGEAVHIVGIPETYCKIRFVSKYHHGATAGLIFSASQLEGKTIAGISRFFPYSEANRMDRLQRSPFFENWNDAFNYEFK
jgi:hypothetical protein